MTKRQRSWPVAAAAVALAATTMFTAAGGAAEAAATPPGGLPGFTDGYALSDGLRIHYAVAGHGPALVLLHGWPETLQAWGQIAPALTANRTVIAVDLRGLGRSQPAGSDEYGTYTALTLAADVRSVVEHLGFGDAEIAVAGHDVGGAVALAYAARYRDQVDHLAVLEAPPTTWYLQLVASKPNLLSWDSFVNGQANGVTEQLVAGREKVFYGSVYNRDGRAPSARNQREYVAAYSRPGSTHAGFEFFRQQDQGEHDVQALLDSAPLAMPVLGLGGQNSMRGSVGEDLGKVASHVTTAVAPNANHWVLEEEPQFIVDQLRQLLAT
ncbi:alpha/beta hydrolase [Streptomyces sp. SP17BM10]|uniref:alpha/beta fold hydrolase n=1 Tax=Streptomyces sp. SP17BM10 TaxID=3002530 RepID=UPI002E779A79|nr:alpha/beta hydrolase [Streptomyces sp. SP17BM10]MEE1783188.1 alpha/beta hydrolase [Streptomyces sp. SP17BM10]